MRRLTGRDAAFAFSGSLLGGITAVAVAIQTEQLPGAHASQVALVGLLVCLTLLSVTIGQVDDATEVVVPQLTPDVAPNAQAQTMPREGSPASVMERPAASAKPDSQESMQRVAQPAPEPSTRPGDASEELIQRILTEGGDLARREAQCFACGSFEIVQLDSGSFRCTRSWCQASTARGVNHVRVRHRPTPTNQSTHNHTLQE